MRTSQKMLLDRAQIALVMLRGLSKQAIAALVLFTVLGIAGIYFATTIFSDIPMSGSGTAALIIGVTFSLILGVDLMSLIFFSSRGGFDEAADLQSKGRTRSEDEATPGR